MKSEIERCSGSGPRPEEPVKEERAQADAAPRRRGPSTSDERQCNPIWTAFSATSTRRAASRRARGVGRCRSRLSIRWDVKKPAAPPPPVHRGSRSRQRVRRMRTPVGEALGLDAARGYKRGLECARPADIGRRDPGRDGTHVRRAAFRSRVIRPALPRSRPDAASAECWSALAGASADHLTNSNQLMFEISRGA